jgi:phosphoribosylanthranilate isomerase
VFRIKICGITSVNDAEVVVGAGADAIGLNFYPQSPRYVTPEQARSILEAVPERVIKVGLFVNAPGDHVCRTFDQLGLELIQLHGDEPPIFLACLGNRPVMRAFRLGREGWQAVTGYLRQCRDLRRMPRLVIVDSLVKGSYGGTGQVGDWSRLTEYPTGQSFPPLVLAGGLTPQNVAEAIRAVRPTAVDTASGVESSPGRKDPAAVGAFVRAARVAFGDV